MKKKPGRPKLKDKRKPLNFRLKESVIKIANDLGRDKVEAIIERSNKQTKNKTKNER